MCRLLAYSAKVPRAVDELFAPEEFDHFRQLSRLHRDGWGMSWVAPPDEASAPLAEAGGSAGETPGRREGRLRARRSVLPAYEDPAFEVLARRRLGSAGFVHMRWATSGLAVAEANTHPFLMGGWAFAHQGSIPSPDRLAALLSPASLAARRGATDSEAYFLHLLQCLQQEGDLIGGVRRAVADIRDACGPASLNALLLSPASLVVVHGSTGLAPPVEDLLAAVTRPEDLPADHLEGYFGLRYRVVNGEIVVASSGLAREGWEDVPADSIVHVDLGRQALSFHSFDPGAHSLEGTAAAVGAAIPAP